MTEKKLDKITEVVRDAVINFLDIDKADLLDLVVSLHNELCKEVDGEYCDYAYHWANLGYGGCPNDSLFKETENDDKCNGCYWNYNGFCTCQGVRPCNYEEVKDDAAG